MKSNETKSNYENRKQEEGSPVYGDAELAAGGEMHQRAGGEHPALTTNQGVRFPTIKIRSEPTSTVLRCWRISSCARRSRISIMSVFRSESFTRVERVCMASSN